MSGRPLAGAGDAVGGAGRAAVPGSGWHGGRRARVRLCAEDSAGGGGTMSYQGKKNIPRITVGAADEAGLGALPAPSAPRCGRGARCRYPALWADKEPPPEQVSRPRR